MYNKILNLGIIFFLLFLLFSPSAISNKFIENENIVNSSFRTIFAASPLITITYEEIKEPVIPNTQAIQIPLKISYELIGRFASWQLRRFSNEVVTIGLSITEQSEGIEANFAESHFDIIVGSNNIFITDLTVTVNEEAPAHTVGTVKIKATSEEISGFFFTHVEEGERTIEVGFGIGYWPVISPSLPEGSYFEIPPMRNTKIPIKITNLGNGPTYVAIKIVDFPKNWNITFPSSLPLASPISGGDYEKEINIDVKPPKDFSRNTINISITPHFLGDPSNQGQTEILTFNFKNDGSYKEDSSVFFLIFIVIIIILVIFGSLFTIRRYFSK